MNDRERRRIEAFDRVKQFSLDNPTDFAAGTIQKVNMDKVKAELVLLGGYTVNQAGSDAAAGSAFESKGTSRENLLAEMEPIARTARMMEYQFDGITELFHFPRNHTDQDLLATARAWVIAAGPRETNMVSYGLPADFIDTLGDSATSFEASFSAPTTAVDNRVAATASLGESIRRGMIALRICDAVMKNHYAANTGKLAAWLSASHVERDPKKPTPTPPTP
jgi:hypothetical protein